MLKLCHISDSHLIKYLYQLIIPECDLLVFTGDIGGRTSLLDIEEFISWLKLQKAKKIIVIAGNHDIILDKDYIKKYKNSQLYKQLIINRELALKLFKDNDIEYLENTGCNYMGYNIWGSPISPSFHRQNWAFNADRGEEIMTYWNQIPKNTHILLTHTPLYEIFDHCREFAKPFEDPHAGCKDLKNLIINELLELKFHGCGHIHDNFGLTQLINKNNDIIMCSNGAVLNNKYELIKKNIPIIDIN